MERREADLVHPFRSYLLRQGHEVSRLRVVPAGESAPLYSDLWDKTARDLIEAKGGVTREQVRMAVGPTRRLWAIRRRKHTRTVLLPSKPRADLMDLLNAAGVDTVYPDGDQ